jgi:hypothetical protein
MRIPINQLNRCAIDGGSMKCTASGYECCYDHGTVCEWSPYSSRLGAGSNVVPPTGGSYLPPSPVRPPIKPPAGPYSPPTKGTPPGPKVVAGTGPMVVAQPNRPTGPRIK